MGDDLPNICSIFCWTAIFDDTQGGTRNVMRRLLLALSCTLPVCTCEYLVVPLIHRGRLGSPTGPWSCRRMLPTPLKIISSRLHCQSPGRVEAIRAPPSEILYARSG